MRIILLAVVASILFSPVLAAPAEPGLYEAGARTLVLSPRADKVAREAAAQLTVGLARAAERMDDHIPALDAELAAATPGDIVARCPARISTRCLARAAELTGVGRTLTGIVEVDGEGFRVRLRLVDAASAETFSTRDVRLSAAGGDEIDMDIAGLCLGGELLQTATGRNVGSFAPDCEQRVLPTSLTDRKRRDGDPESWERSLWLSVIPGPEQRVTYEARNSMLAGAFASTVAVGVIGIATAALLGIQSSISGAEALDLARQHPEALRVDGQTVAIQNETAAATQHYREIRQRGQWEALGGLAAGMLAIGAGVGGVALYQMTDLPGRYDAYEKMLRMGEEGVGTRLTPGE